jgi:hypothetical protein
MRKAIFCMLFAVLAGSAGPAFSQQQIPAGDGLIVGYYGRPGVSSLGVLGQHSIDELMPIIKAKAAEYDQLNGDQSVTPAFHLIYGLAAGDPGRDKKYLLPLSHDKLVAYIEAAQSNGFLVIIDTQLGALTPAEAIKPVLKYLDYSSVHLAVDPEFEVHNLDVRPGKIVGHVTGEQINEVQSAMSDYLEENNISEHKMLIVHQFTKNMVQDKNAVKPFKQIDVIMNLDGHGSPQLKVSSYNQLYNQHASSRVAGGFKLFFQEDTPTMMTPKQVLGMENVGKSKIGTPPKYINYQ